jgi:hypothetical protein
MIWHMAKKHTHHTTNPFNGTDEDLSLGELGDLQLTDLSVEKIAMKLFQRFGGDMGAIAGNLAMREGGFLVAEKVLSPITDKLLEFTFSKVAQDKLPVSQEQAQKWAHLGVDGVAIAAESLVRLGNAAKRDNQLRHMLHEELDEYLQAGEKGIGLTSSVQMQQHPNKVLAVAEQRIRDQFNHSLIQSGLALIGGVGQYTAKRIDAPVWQGELETEAQDIQAALAADSTNAHTVKTQQARLKEIENLQKQDVRNIAAILADDHDNGAMGRANMATATAVGSGWVGHRFMQGQVNARKEAASTVIAYDLIQYLDGYLKNEKTEGGKINLANFKKEFPKHTFLKLDNDKSLVPLEEFIAEIFTQHVHDCNHKNSIGSLHQDHVADVSKQITNALTGKDLSMTPLNPITLIKIVGEGKLLAHEGNNVANAETVKEVIDECRAAFSADRKIDTEAYMHKLVRNPQEIIDTTQKLPQDLQDFTLFLIPSSVVREQMQGFNIREDDLKAAKRRAKEEGLETVKKVVSDLAALSDRELEEHQMLSKSQRGLIRKAQSAIEKGDEEALITLIRDGSPEGLRYAVLSAGEYWQETAEKKHEVTATSKPETHTRELEEKEKPSAANSITDFERKHPANDDVESKRVSPKAHIEGDGAAHKGKVEEHALSHKR